MSPIGTEHGLANSARGRLLWVLLFHRRRVGSLQPEQPAPLREDYRRGLPTSFWKRLLGMLSRRVDTCYGCSLAGHEKEDCPVPNAQQARDVQWSGKFGLGWVGLGGGDQRQVQPQPAVRRSAVPVGAITTRTLQSAAPPHSDFGVQTGKRRVGVRSICDTAPALAGDTGTGGPARAEPRTEPSGRAPRPA